jgi:cystathionine beta-lyase/cystathionine gamma-synthase
VPALLLRRLADLEGAESALLLASGRAAVACTSLALLRPGDHLLACSWLRDDTRRFFEEELPLLGVQVTFVDPRETRGWRRGLTRTTRALYVESPVLESGRIVELQAPRTLAQELGLALIVDASAASPVRFRPIAHGADIVLHDTAIFLDGQPDGSGGVVAGTDGLVEEVRRKMERWGGVPHVLASTQLERSLATLQVRVERQTETAGQLACWAQQHPAVRAVSYAALPSHPDHDVLPEYMTGAGAMLQLQLAGGHDDVRVATVATARMAGASRLSSMVTQVTPGAVAGWVRVHVGLEPLDAITAALCAALPATANPTEA